MGNYSYQAFERDAQGLYDHLLNIRKLAPPEELLAHFSELLIEGRCDRAPDVLAQVDRLMASSWADRDFPNIFNRCCYILINQWWSHANLQGFIHELMEMLTVPASVSSDGSDGGDRRSQLLTRFQATPQFDLLHRRAKVMDDRQQWRIERQTLLSELIPRYPALYPYCLLDSNSSQIDRHAVRQLQEVKSRQFEQDLLTYGTAILDRKGRAIQSATSQGATIQGAMIQGAMIQGSMIQGSTIQGRTIQGQTVQGRTIQGQTVQGRTIQTAKQDFANDLVQLKNPTLLSDRDLERAIRQFSGKVEGDRTYLDSAQQCLQALDRTHNYRQLKHSVYDYLTDSIVHSSKPLFGRYRFDAWLAEQVTQIQPQINDQVPNSFLLVRTCSQLLDTLVANPKTNPSNHIVFVDLVSNFGASFVMGMLLKLLLLCRNFKAHLVSLEARVAQRLSDLFKHYEACNQSEVHWLVDCLDNWMVASCIHFGSEDFQRWEYLV